ncbi:MAG TPA: hypothetical protein VIN10_02105 [Bacteroidales bacterium]
MKKIFLFFAFIFSSSLLVSQNLYTYLNNDYNYEIQKALYSNEVHFHTSIQPWRTGDIKQVVNYDSLLQLGRMNKEISKKGWQKTWNKAFNDNVVSLYKEDFWFALNPLLNFDFGQEFNENKSSYINTRGFEAKGELGKYFAFYTNFLENQGTFVNYLDENITVTKVVPGQGLVRGYGNEGYDYASSTGYISFSAKKYFNFQLGYGKNFIGDGYRSLLLSDNAFNYPFFKFNINFWNINYMVIYNQMLDINVKISPNLGYMKKYSTTHYLSWAASKRFNIGIFETIVWQGQDSTGYRGFDVAYLNPIIFLRPVEFSLGSPDNALLGINASYIVGKHNTFYGQFIIDEFKLAEWTSGDGWWGNKFGFQVGFKTYDVFKIKNLYFQTEYNEVRPYTYAHSSSIKNYGHYNAALAHPIGGNFKESVTFLKYHYKRLYFSYEFQYAQIGEDIDTLNYGRNIYLSYNTRVSDYNNYTGQGLKTSVIYNNITASFLINPSYNLNLAIGYTYRSSKNDVETLNTSFFHIGLRTSIGRHYYDF